MRRACGCDPRARVYCEEGARLHGVIKHAYGRLVDSVDDKFQSTRHQWQKAYDKARADWLSHISDKEAA